MLRVLQFMVLELRVLYGVWGLETTMVNQLG